MDNYDVAVIGAGPAGVMAAWKAAQEGANTLLLEREKNPGRKPCAEGILSEVLPDAEVGPMKEFAINKITGAYLYAPDERKRVDVGGEGYILDKPAFLHVLAKRAGETGAEITYGGVVEDAVRENGSVHLTGKQGGKPFSIKSNVVIGCDGTGSILARRFFPRRNYQVIAAYQYSMTDCNVQDESKLEIFVGHEKAPAGYIWIFPKGERKANVGIGLKGSGAKQLLDRFIAGHPSVFSRAKIEISQAAPVPVGGEIEEYVSNGLMLCGDAAGQVIPLTGAGIHTSLVAGKIAGGVAAKAVREGDTTSKGLSEYKLKFEELFGGKIANSLKALDSFERFSDAELNIITELLDGQDLIEMANGFSPTKAIGLLLRHPVLAFKVASQLLNS